MIRINRRGNATYILATIIVSVLTFVIYLSFFSGIAKGTISTVDDVGCRTYISMKDTKAIKLGEFFYSINNKCKIDKDIKVDLEEKEDAFKSIAEGLSHCWYRYGEGEKDFLSNFDTSGNWCFLCGTIKMKDNGESIHYNEFIKWTEENKYNDSMNYSMYINMKYTDIGEKEILHFRDEYETILEDDPGAEMKSMLFAFGEEITAMNDLRLKRLDANDENLYIVYRYDRLDKSFKDKIDSAATSAGWGMAGALVAGVIAEASIEGAIWGAGAGAATFWAGGIGAIPGFLFGVAKGAVTGTYHTIVGVKKLYTLAKNVKNLKSFLKSTKIARLVGVGSDVVRTEVAVISTVRGEYKIAERIKKFEASEEDLRTFSKLIEDSNKAMAQDFIALADLMKDMGVKNLGKIDSAILKAESKGMKNYERVGKMIDSIDDAKLDELAKMEVGNVNNIVNLRALKDIAKKEVEAMKAGVEVKEPLAIRDYLRATTVIGAGFLGGVLGYTLNGDYSQYVDLLTKEQYYRLCGTEPSNFD